MADRPIRRPNLQGLPKLPAAARGRPVSRRSALTSGPKIAAAGGRRATRPQLPKLPGR